MIATLLCTETEIRHFTSTLRFCVESVPLRFRRAFYGLFRSRAV